MSDLKSPKDRLLAHAMREPRQVLIVTEAGGHVTTDISFVTAPDALFMLYQLEKNLKVVIEGVLRGLETPPSQQQEL